MPEATKRSSLKEHLGLFPQLLNEEGVSAKDELKRCTKLAEEGEKGKAAMLTFH